MKIADFGLSKHLYDDPVYVKNQDGKLPIRWMAIEAILERKYSVQSDVYVTPFYLLCFCVMIIILCGHTSLLIRKRVLQFSLVSGSDPYGSIHDNMFGKVLNRTHTHT